MLATRLLGAADGGDAVSLALLPNGDCHRQPLDLIRNSTFTVRNSLMLPFISHFQPGPCRDPCFCSRCGGPSPITWDVTILGKTYTLARSRLTHLGEVSTEACLWLAALAESIDCAAATHVSLSLRSGDWFLQVRRMPGNILLRAWQLFVDPPVDCGREWTLPDATPSTAECHGSTDEAVIRPGPSRTCCGECGGSSGSSGGAGTHACGNGCCAQGDAALQMDVDLGAGGWTDRRCNGCSEVQGVYTLDATDPLLGCGWSYGVADYCPNAGCPVGFDLRLDLARRNVGGQCRWELVVKATSPTSECEGIAVEATYVGALEPAGAACTLAAPVALTKVADSACSSPLCACDGALPAACHIQSV
jgi:hypothetical protein